MIHFADLFQLLESSHEEQEAETYLSQYFHDASKVDALWVIALIYGKRPKRLISIKQLIDLAEKFIDLPPWLISESIEVVGDTSESIALLLPKPDVFVSKPLHQILGEVISFQQSNLEKRQAYILSIWNAMTVDEVIVFNKLITGTFKLKLEKGLLGRTLSNIYKIPLVDIVHRLSGDWSPLDITFQDLVLESNNDSLDAQPYPFLSAMPIQDDPLCLSNEIANYIIEWLWDGLRVQLVKRSEKWFLWNADLQLLTDKFPDLEQLVDKIPNGTVIDGLLLSGHGINPKASFHLRDRLQLKSVTKKQMLSNPIKIVAIDLLEWKGKDSRSTSIEVRRALISELITQIDDPKLMFSQALHFSNWHDVVTLKESAGKQAALGLVFKKTGSFYDTEKQTGDWWYWKVEPHTIKAVLMYVQLRQGNHVDPFVDLSFGVWDGDQLVSIAKAEPNFPDLEKQAIARFVLTETIEKFGPVRTVPPKLVFEIQFDRIEPSKRHKSGVKLQNPRISNWLKDSTVEVANSLDDLKSFIQ